VPLVQSLSTDFAGRYTNYSNFGGVYTWKIGGDWHVDDNIHFRSTMSFDIRAPNLNDLYQPAGVSSTGFTDLLTGVASNTRLVSRGNPNLTYESAHTYTAGVVLTPTFIPNFNLSVDWYMTHMTNAITTISGQGTDQQNLCMASAPAYDSPFCGLYVRPYAPGSAEYTTAANYPTEVWSAPTNAAIQQMEGWNIEANYRFAVDDIVSGWAGDIMLRNLATYQPVNFSRTLTTAYPTWAFQPKFRQSTFLSYSNGDFTLSLQNQFLSSTKKATSEVTAAKQNYAIASLGSNDVLDATISERFEMWGSHSEAYFTVNNVANTRAPLYTAGTAGLAGLFYPTAGFHDDMGRYFTLGIKGTF